MKLRRRKSKEREQPKEQSRPRPLDHDLAIVNDRLAENQRRLRDLREQMGLDIGRQQ